MLILSPDYFTFLSYKLIGAVFSACHVGFSIQELIFSYFSIQRDLLLSHSLLLLSSFCPPRLWQMLVFLRRHPQDRKYSVV